MQIELNDKRIVITGGTSGVGRALVALLHPTNELVVVGRNATKLKELAQAFSGITTLQADLSDLMALRTAIAQLQHSGPIDILINNAAIQHTPAFTDPDFDPTTIGHEVTVNFTSVCLLIHGLLPNLKAASGAHILNVNSALAIVPKKSSAIYCATKGALNILSQSLRYQLEDTDIQVQQAFLPMVDTAMTTGRGNGKISVLEAAQAIIRGLVKTKQNNLIGKVKFLLLIHRLCPALAIRILKGA